ncbi:alpha/beta hydrolase [Mucilaginibacter sp. SG564]|uniref:alpha/beta hydrolase n=1 Tax=Mucilaginibacter sp. SG564 TaxID=2587022 RepID=UPI0015562717|nr:alpha/beta hydrolase [Mucilaginibacter sp. SG564]NOW96361.1 acetyl esterase [Mucilaginibacter sp. SG564]
MALSKEVLDTIAFSKEHGFDKLNLAPPEETRKAMAKAAKDPGPTQVADVIHKSITKLSIPVRIYIPFGEGPFPVVSYYHGGGFVLMGLETHDEICRQLCKNTGSIVMSVAYQLAPEHPYPQGPESSVAAAIWLFENAAEFNGTSERMAVAGDSAGGYMALYVARMLTRQSIALKAQFATYPVTDHYGANHPSYQENGTDYVLTAEIMKWFWDNYVTDPALCEEASILRSADFSGLPPALIFTCNYDPLRDEGKAYADKLQKAGVPIIYKNYENIHGFFGTEKMGEQAMQAASAFLKDQLNR